MKNSFLFLWLCLATCAMGKEKIYFVAHAGAGDPFWNIIYQGARQAGLDEKVDVHFMAPETPNDLARQVELLDAAIAAKPDAIALTVPNDLSLARSLRKARDLKIPVVLVNSRPSPQALAKNPHLAFIGMDDYVAGQKVGERAWASGKIQSRVLIANHQPGHAGLEHRRQGIQDYLSARGITVAKLDIGDDAAAVTNVLQSYLNRNPDTSAVFCLGPACLHAIGRFFQKKQRPIYLASFDLSPFTVQLIREGGVAFTIDQDPYRQGYLGISQLVALLRTHKFPQSVDTASSFVDKQNASEVFDLVKKGLR